MWSTLGNHEFDYGLPHLLFLEKIANFPIVNANLYIRKNNKRLMQPLPHHRDGRFDILFIGIITDKVIDAIQRRPRSAAFVSLEEATQEVGKICNAYKNDDIDLTVLLTHIGFESDKRAGGDAESGLGRGHDHRRPLAHRAGAAGGGQRHPDRPGRRGHGPDRPL